MPDDIGCDRLHDQDRVRPVTIAIVEILRHTEHHDVVFLFHPGDECPLVSDLPGLSFNIITITGKYRNLPGGGVQDCIAHKELPAHHLFHVLADGVKFLAHRAVL